MIVGIDGLGSVGLRAARELVGTPGTELRLRSGDPKRVATALEAFGTAARSWGDADEPAVVVLAGRGGRHAAAARRHLDAGRSVVSTSDDPDDIAALLALDPVAREAGSSIAVGVAFSPGVSCLLARHAADALDVVGDVRVAMIGAGGPACLERRRDAQGGSGPEWVGGGWSGEPPGPSTELVWFPDPIGPSDCHRGALAEPVLLQRAFPAASSLSARSAVPRAPRFSIGPRRPYSEPIGAVRVEVTGRRGDAESMIVYAVVDRPSLAAGTLAAVVATAPRTPGSAGLAERDDALVLLAELARRGVKAATFEPSS